jgi:hypothetical protein
MNSYVNLIIEAESARERLRKWVQSIPEVSENGGCACRTRRLTQSHASSVEPIIWIASCLVAILGLVKAGQSEHPLFWLVIWPFPVAIACTIFIFVREGFHFEGGVLVLGRGRVDAAVQKDSDHKSSFRDP